MNPEYSLEGLMLKLKLQYFGHLMQTADSLEKSLMLGKKEKGASEDEMGGWHHRCSEYELGQTLGDGEGHGGLVCCSPWGCMQRVGDDLATEQLCHFKPDTSFRTLSLFSKLESAIQIVILPTF